MKHVLHPTMDFETRSEAELLNVGAYKYCEHPSTIALCLSYDLLDGKGLRLWACRGPGPKAIPKDLFDHIERGGLCEAHNAEFEYLVWNIVLPRQFPGIRIPRLNLTQIRCSAAAAAALAQPRSLENLGNALNAPKKKDIAGKKDMLIMSKPRKPTKDDPSKWVETPEAFKKLYAYNGDDVLAEMSVASQLIPLSPTEQKVFEYTIKINERGVYCDVELCRTAIRFASIYLRTVSKELHTLTKNEIQTVGQGDKIKKFLKRYGCVIPNMQAQTVVDYLKRTDLHPTARRMLEIRQMLGKSSLSKYHTLLKCVGEDNRLRGLLMYHGASTGRFTGKLFQPHNLPQGTIKDIQNVYEALKENDYQWFTTLYPNVFEALSSSIRGMLCAAPGKKFIFADFAQIEVRVLFWLTGCTLGIEGFKGDGLIYEEMAQAIYDLVKVTKETHPFERTVGKHTVLGAGFQMGWKRFIQTCAKFGVTVDAKLAKKAIKAYREKFVEVKEFWKQIEEAAVTATKTGKLVKLTKLQFLTKNGYLWVRLPSGRKLAYYKPGVRWKTIKFEIEKDGKTEFREQEKEVLSYMAVHPKSGRLYREDTYGGKLTENVVQAIARDLMVEGMGRLEVAGYPIIMNVHDEIGAEVDEEFGSVEEFEEIMAEVPKWGEGIPVKAEGWEGHRFKK